MRTTAASRIVCAIVMGVVAITALPRAARADNVTTLIKQLEDDSEKVRLSAALNLTRNGDERAIPPLVKALNNDDDKNVRGAAAVGLGKLVTSGSKYKNLAIASLKQVAANDSSDFVKQQAAKSLATITGTAATTTTTTTSSSGGTTSSGAGGIYVNVGPMSSKTGTNDKKNQALMVTIATKTLGKSAPNMKTTWSGGVPSKNDLAKKAMDGFYVDGTLNELKATTSGSTSTVSCKISMLLASFPDKSVFGFLNGGAKVQASASERDIALAQEDCVTAVVEDLIAKKIIPTICTKTQASCP